MDSGNKKTFERIAMRTTPKLKYTTDSSRGKTEVLDSPLNEPLADLQQADVTERQLPLQCGSTIFPIPDFHF
jgi:hypothetical protein